MSEKEKKTPEYEVEKMLNSKEVGNKTPYYVLWKEGDKTWEHEENLANATKLLASYLTQRQKRMRY